MPQQAITSSESRIRLTAFFVLVLIIVYFITGIGLIPVFLLLDFTLRGFGLGGFGLGAYSPLGWIAGRLAIALRLPAKPVYMPPKRFAARIGFLFAWRSSLRIIRTCRPSSSAPSSRSSPPSSHWQAFARVATYSMRTPASAAGPHPQKMNCPIREICIIFRLYVESQTPKPSICNGIPMPDRLHEWRPGTGASYKEIPVRHNTCHART